MVEVREWLLAKRSTLQQWQTLESGERQGVFGRLMIASRFPNNQEAWCVVFACSLFGLCATFGGSAET